MVIPLNAEAVGRGDNKSLARPHALADNTLLG
jgi:hypothetical protein